MCALRTPSITAANQISWRNRWLCRAFYRHRSVLTLVHTQVGRPISHQDRSSCRNEIETALFWAVLSSQRRRLDHATRSHSHASRILDGISTFPFFSHFLRTITFSTSYLTGSWPSIPFITEQTYLSSHNNVSTQRLPLDRRNPPHPRAQSSTLRTRCLKYRLANPHHPTILRAVSSSSKHNPARPSTISRTTASFKARCP